MSERQPCDKRAVLDSLGVYVSTPSGNSMRPMLRGERDSIALEKYEGRLRPLDVCLYVRQDGRHVLHRVIRVREHDYIIRGDNCAYTEVGITDNDIIGRLSGFWRGKRYISCHAIGYRIYARVWTWFYPLRFCFIRLRQATRRLLAKSRLLRRIYHRIRRKPSP